MEPAAGAAAPAAAAQGRDAATAAAMPPEQQQQQPQQEQQQEEQAAEQLPRAAWREYPPGSSHFTMRISENTGSTKTFHVPGTLQESSGFNLGGLLRGTVRMEPAGSAAGASDWSYATYRSKNSIVVRMSIPKELFRSKQLKAGDVLAVRNVGPRHALYEVWPAGSPAALEFLDFERTARGHLLPRASGLAAAAAAVEGGGWRRPVAAGAGAGEGAAAGAGVGGSLAMSEREEGEQQAERQSEGSEEGSEEEEEQSWLQCDACGKWRLVSEECLWECQDKEARCRDFTRPDGTPCTCRQPCDDCGRATCECASSDEEAAAGQRVVMDEDDVEWEPKVEEEAAAAAAEEEDGPSRQLSVGKRQQARSGDAGRQPGEQELLLLLEAAQLADSDVPAWASWPQPVGPSSGGGQQQQQQQPKPRGRPPGGGKKGKTSRFIGVTRHNGRWRAQLYHGGKGIFLGLYHDEVQAALAWDKAVRELRGPNAKVNFPDEASPQQQQDTGHPSTAPAAAAAVSGPDAAAAAAAAAAAEGVSGVPPEQQQEQQQQQQEQQQEAGSVRVEPQDQGDLPRAASSSQLKRPREEEEGQAGLVQHRQDLRDDQEEEEGAWPAGGALEQAAAGDTSGGGGGKKRRKGASRYRGVKMRGSGRWRTDFYQSGKHITLGTYNTEEEAARAWDKAAIQLRGPAAKTNLPVSTAEIQRWLAEKPIPSVAAMAAMATTAEAAGSGGDPDALAALAAAGAASLDWQQQQRLQQEPQQEQQWAAAQVKQEEEEANGGNGSRPAAPDASLVRWVSVASLPILPPGSRGVVPVAVLRQALRASAVQQLDAALDVLYPPEPDESVAGGVPAADAATAAANTGDAAAAVAAAAVAEVQLPPPPPLQLSLQQLAPAAPPPPDLQRAMQQLAAALASVEGAASLAAAQQGTGSVARPAAEPARLPPEPPSGSKQVSAAGGDEQQCGEERQASVAAGGCTADMEAEPSDVSAGLPGAPSLP